MARSGARGGLGLALAALVAALPQPLPLLGPDRPLVAAEFAAGRGAHEPRVASAGQPGAVPLPLGRFQFLEGDTEVVRNRTQALRAAAREAQREVQREAMRHEREQRRNATQIAREARRRERELQHEKVRLERERARNATIAAREREREEMRLARRREAERYRNETAALERIERERKREEKLDLRAKRIKAKLEREAAEAKVLEAMKEAKEREKAAREAAREREREQRRAAKRAAIKKWHGNPHPPPSPPPAPPNPPPPPSPPPSPPSPPPSPPSPPPISKLQRRRLKRCRSSGPCESWCTDVSDPWHVKCTQRQGIAHSATTRSFVNEAWALAIHRTPSR